MRGHFPRIVALGLLAASLAAPVRADVIDRILAIVGPQLVTLSDVHAALALKLVEPTATADRIGDALSFLIDRRLVMAEVDRYVPPEPDETAVAQRAAELRRSAAGEVLAALGLDAARVSALARDDLRIQAYLNQRFGVVQPTDDDVAGYYRDHPGDFTRGGELLPLGDVLAQARQKLASERRARLVASWIADLRRRADINVLYLPGPAGVRR